MTRRALVVGRFQPPHRGHLHCLQEAARLAHETIVVVGSAQLSHIPSDPFTAGERLEMLAVMAAEAELARPWLVPVNDLGQHHLWVAHVAAHVPAFDVVVGGNPLTLDLFAAAGHAVHKVALKERPDWSGTAVRRRLVAREPVAETLTPAVARFLERAEVKRRFAVFAELQEKGTG